MLPSWSGSWLALPVVSEVSMSKSESRPSLGPRLRTPDAARYLGISPSTLEKMRCAGTGPEFEGVGGKAVVYSIHALEEYLAQRRARSTSEMGKPTPRPRRRKNTRNNPVGRPNPTDSSSDRSDDGTA
jgi:predicted DNA-binding transcriptional regulator AlpA